MRGIATVVTVLILALTVVARAEEGDWSGNFNILAGRKTLDEKHWDPVDHQFSLAMELDFKKDTWPVSAALQVLWSYNSKGRPKYYTRGTYFGSDVDSVGETTEFAFGVRKTWERLPLIKPFIGAGGSIVKARLGDVAWFGLATNEEDDIGPGYWIDGGAYLRLAQHFHVGFRARYSGSRLELFDERVNAGGWDFQGLIGLHW